MDLLIERVNSFKDLTHGWNGYGAEPINPELITHSVDFMKSFFEGIGLEKAQVFQVFPTARDSIQLETGRSTNKYLEIELSLTGDGIYVEYSSDDFLEKDNLPLEQVINYSKTYFDRQQDKLKVYNKHTKDTT